MFENRRKYLRNVLSERQLDAVLIDSPSNLYYYTGFTGGEAIFYLLADGNAVREQNKRQSESGYLITDSRYYEQVEKECPEITLVRLEHKGYGETVRELLEYSLHEKTAPLSGEVSCQSRQNGRKYGCVGVEDSMPLSRYLKLNELCKEYSFQMAGEVIRERRMVKDEEELARLAKAEAIGDAAFSHILDVIKPGISEAEIAWELEFFMKRNGASRLSFDTIVASGAHSSMPHAKVTDKKIEYGDFVTMDFGCVYQGYCSDMTRTVAVGTPTDEMKKIYRIVWEANCLAMEGIREGVSCMAVDAIARDYIREQGYGDYFGHGLGHGVGLDIHEEPRFSPKCEVIAKENMVITDEPGIYLPGQFGVRIEDMVVVKRDGCESLSHSRKELIIL